MDSFWGPIDDFHRIGLKNDKLGDRHFLVPIFSFDVGSNFKCNGNKWWAFVESRSNLVIKLCLHVKCLWDFNIMKKFRDFKFCKIYLSKTKPISFEIWERFNKSSGTSHLVDFLSPKRKNGHFTSLDLVLNFIRSLTSPSPSPILIKMYLTLSQLTRSSLVHLVCKRECDWYRSVKWPREWRD